MRFKIDWASLIVGSKFTVFALFYFVFEGNFPSTSPRGAYIWRGDLTEGFLRYEFGGLIFGGAYTWRCLFSEFYGILFFILNRRLFKDNVNKPCRMHLSTFDLLCVVSYYGEGKKLNGGGIRKHVKNHEKEHSVHD